MTDTIRLLALDIGFAVLGVAVVLLAGIPRGRSWLPTVAGLAPAAGIAACGIVASLGAMVGIDVRPLVTMALTVVALLLAWLVIRRRRPGIGSLSTPRAGAAERALELVSLAVLVVLSVAIVRLHAATVLDAWDGWAMWGPKAHALFVEGDVWGPAFREPAYRMQHQEYPVLFPALEALSASAVGRFDPALIDIESAAVLVAFGWGAWALLRLVVTPAVAGPMALALTGSAPLIENGAANYADSVVASFTALGLLCLLVWLTKGSSATLLLAGLFLAAAASTKAEGLLFALAAITAAVAVARGFGRSVRAALAFGIGVLAVPIVWTIVDRLNGPGARNVDRGALVDPGTMLDAAGRIPTAAWRLLEEIANGWLLASFAVTTAVLGACLVRLWWHAAFVGLWGALAFSALVGVYYASTAPIDWHLGTSADRVVFSIVLGLATMAPVLAGSVWERLTTRFNGALPRS
jgi:hypothetical protein